ncbi:MAG: tRNA (adenosine(37)-N6)-threonylcarbamoyltransferase complex dimerization subunit type 1 TsaB [bacterium]
MSKLVLGIETSHDVGGVALAESGGSVAEALSTGRLKHSEELMKLVDAVLERADSTFDHVDGVAVSVGPGSFTGLRVGLATAKGLCLSRSLPLAAVPTLDALAGMCCDSPVPVHAVIDARRGEVYWCSYEFECGVQKRTANYLAVTPQRLAGLVSGETLLIGSGVEAYRDFIVRTTKGRATFMSPNPQSPSPSVIAVMGLEMLESGQAREIESLEPIYIRPSDAEIK